MAKIVITGVAGFLGSHLAQRLLGEGHQIIGIDNLSGGFIENVPLSEKLTFYVTDLSKFDGPFSLAEESYLEKFKPDLLFHLAADATEGRSQFTPISSTRNNFMASVNTFTHCIRAGVKKIVFTSSMSRYGDQPPPFSEELEPKPADIYGINKVATERALQVLASIYGFDWTIIVPHNVFGPGQNIQDPYRNVVGIFMNRIMRGKPPIIYGDGQQTRAFTYVDNFTPYLARAGFNKNCNGEIINIGPTQKYTINQLAQMVLDALGSDLKSDLKPVYYPDRPLEVKHAYCTVDKATHILGYQTHVGLQDGIQKMVRWLMELDKDLAPPPMRYLEKLELTNRKTPKTWTKKEM